MKPASRLTSFFLLVISIAVSSAIYSEWTYIGFPDGYKTNLDRINETLYLIYSSGYALLSLSFLVVICFPKNISFKWVIITFLSFSAIIITLNFYLQNNIENGTGG